MNDPIPGQPQETRFLAVSITVNSGGIDNLSSAEQIHILTFYGAQGERLMLSFSRTIAQTAVRNRAIPIYDIDCPLPEYAPTIAQLTAILPRPVEVLVVEAANGVTSWQFTGSLF